MGHFLYRIGGLKIWLYNNKKLDIFIVWEKDSVLYLKDKLNGKNMLIFTTRRTISTTDVNVGRNM